MTHSERYDGRPLLLITENYVLAAIGELSTEKQAGVAGVVQQVWGGTGDWMRTVREQMDWDETIDESILANWTGYREAAGEQGAPADATDFAMMFADEVWRQSAALPS